MRLNWIVLLVTGAALAPAASLSLEGSVSNPGALVTARQLSQEALSQAQAGEGAKARDTMNEALSQAANDAVIIGNNANLLLLEGRFADSVRAYDVLLQSDEVQDYALYLNRSLALRALGDYAGAQRDYQNYLRTRSVTAPLPRTVEGDVGPAPSEPHKRSSEHVQQPHPLKR